jgi:hypothetical protein
MAITINAKGTSVSQFTIGKNGTTIYQGINDPYPVYSPINGDLWIDKSTNSLKMWWQVAGSPPIDTWKSPRLGDIEFDDNTITSISGSDLILQASIGQDLYLHVNKWPYNDGSAQQVLITDGDGNLGWQTIENISNVSTNDTFYVPFLSSNTSEILQTNTSSNLNFNPNTGVLSATIYKLPQSSTGTSTFTTSTTTANQLIDSVDASIYRTVKYLIQVKSGTSFQSSELLVVHDDTDTFSTEYATIYTDTILATFDTVLDAGLLKLLATPANSTTTIKTFRTAILS